MCVDLRPSSMSSLSATCHSTWTRSNGCFPSAARPVTLSPWRKQRSRLTLAPSTQVTIAVGLSLLHPPNHPRVLSHLAGVSSSPGNTTSHSSEGRTCPGFASFKALAILVSVFLFTMLTLSLHHAIILSQVTATDDTRVESLSENEEEPLHSPLHFPHLVVLTDYKLMFLTASPRGWVSPSRHWYLKDLGKGSFPDSCADHVLSPEGVLRALTSCLGSVVPIAIKACFCNTLSSYDLEVYREPLCWVRRCHFYSRLSGSNRISSVGSR